ncbi:amidohydrolase family protein [Salinimicrobium sp. MT39]|uniref:Amidohydrolase family protein n=1 Tax=Salinimicrobium profundisediminis TaxID=2994553 RepID=A0A9X3CZU8_9FLAO|nr:amidohydrolase family protein [Salinimicrobium profundisediminis]MCX2838689.1 amidohydrolase family protein [Salinimicrobium profundisediminis]
MKIDAHQHFWQYDAEKYSWISDEMAVIRKDFSPEDLEPLLSKRGFSGCVAVQADQSEAETEVLLKMAKKHDFIKGVVGWVDLGSPEVEERLKHYSKNTFLKGIRHTVWDEKGEFMMSSEFQHGISFLANLGLTYDILVFDYQLGGAVELVKAFPRQKFVLDHMGKPQISGKPDKQWVEQIQQLASFPNVWCKISGLVTETPDFSWKTPDFFPILEVVIDAFGVDRLIFGSDWPVCLSAASYSEVNGIIEKFFSSYSKEDKEKIFGKNAAEFYNL